MNENKSFPKKIGFMTFIDIIKCLKQIKSPISESPSAISDMEIIQESKKSYNRGTIELINSNI